MFTDSYPLTAHNSFVLAFAETGLLGAYFWVGLIYVSLLGLRRLAAASSAAPPDPWLLAWARHTQVAFIGFLTAIFFLSRTYNVLLYLLVGFRGRALAGRRGGETGGALRPHPPRPGPGVRHRRLRRRRHLRHGAHARPLGEPVLLRDAMTNRNVLHLIWTLKLAGAERIAQEILRGCREGGLGRPTSARSRLPTSPTGRSGSALGIRVYSVTKHLSLDVTLPFRLAALLRNRDIGVLHTHNAVCGFYGGLAAWLAGVRHVHTEHSNLPASRRALRFFLRRILRHATVVADSQESRHHASAPGASQGARRAPDLQRRQPLHAGDFTERPRHARVPPFAPVIGAVGNLRPVKNHRLLVEAFAQLAAAYPDAFLVILGEGSQRKALEELVRSKALTHRVRMPGYQLNPAATCGCSTSSSFPRRAKGFLFRSWKR